MRPGVDSLASSNGHGQRIPDVTRTYVTRADGFVEVHDLDFAVYCGAVRGLTVVDLEEDPQDGLGGRGTRGPARYVILLRAQPEEMRVLAADFVNSESAKFADGLRRFKKVIRVGRGKSPRR